MNRPIRLLIVDDSALMRQQLTARLSSDPRFEVIGVARDGREGVEKAVKLLPDVVTMDIHMPQMDGITAMQYILDLTPCAIIILSAYSRKGALVTFEALELGAFDYVTKPEYLGPEELDGLIRKLKERILASPARRDGGGGSSCTTTLSVDCSSSSEYSYRRAVMIGASTGGPKTIMDVLQHIPRDFPAPIFLVQHMPSLFTSSFAERLNQKLKLRAVEAAHRMIVEPGVVYVAPGGRHMHIEKVIGKMQLRIAIRSLPADTAFRPSVDVSMHSLAEHYPAHKIVAVLLTGMGVDGAQSMAEIRRRGGVTIAESEQTAIVYGMPKAAVEQGGAEHILPSYQIGKVIVNEVRGHGI